PFNTGVLHKKDDKGMETAEQDYRVVVGNDPAQLADTLRWFRDLHAGGGTDIYKPTIFGMQLVKQLYPDYASYSLAFDLMTDGESDGSFAELQQAYRQLGFEGIPIHAIGFGDAKWGQLDQLTKFSSGKLFDGRKDLAKAFRDVKGYNN